MIYLLIITNCIFLVLFIRYKYLFSKLLKITEQTSEEKYDYMDKYLQSFYKYCGMIRTLDDDYTNFVTLLESISPIIDNDDIKSEIERFKTILSNFQKTKLSVDRPNAEDFMREYEISRIERGE